MGQPVWLRELISGVMEAGRGGAWTTCFEDADLGLCSVPPVNIPHLPAGDCHEASAIPCGLLGYPHIIPILQMRSPRI